ncbi:hypothetical protein PVK06_024547 [Gossypium arboreum]|uniref:Uncharacterized protein n=1 Tax=Gossypium arboreum TaxID=29729 RepID=A0ABR0PE49_GOSAR|nr:hypothetical protein PVK06_024547 [Gossypium arboreum]
MRQRKKGMGSVMEKKRWKKKEKDERHFERILIQTDSIEVINVILEDSSRNSNFALVRKIHHILKRVE